MTDVITKVSIGGQVYPFAGGGSEGQEVVYLTQAEYDALPASKLTDGKIYKIKTSGVAPTPGGGTAVERGDMLLSTIWKSCDVDGYYLSFDYYYMLKNNMGITLKQLSQSSGSSYITVPSTYHGYLIIISGQGGSSSTGYLGSYDINNNESYTYQTDHKYIDEMKLSGEYVYIKILGSTNTYKRFNLDLTGETDITKTEYDNVQDYKDSYNGLFYTQDGNDYVASDIEGTEVKRYVGVGTIDGIANGKLYRNVGDVAYAIATI